MRLLTILQRICRLFYRKEKDIVDNNVDYATSRERKIKIVQEYYKQREIEAHETYLHEIERNNIYFERFELSKEWNIVTCNNILESDNLILYLCRNMNHSSCEVHLLKKGDNINTPFWKENSHDNGDGQVIPCAYREIPSYQDTNASSSSKWNIIHSNIKKGENVPNQILDSTILLLQHQGKTKYLTLYSCLYTYGIINYKTLCWESDDFILIGYLKVDF